MYHIHPWQMIDVSSGEYAELCADMDEKNKAAKQASSRG